MASPAKPAEAVAWPRLVSFSDEALMEHLRAGNHDALGVLFDRYHRLVLNIALRILRDVGEAEDLMQSVFLEILRSSNQFDSTKGTPKVWILQYAYHRSFNRRQYLVLRGLYERPGEGEIVARSGAPGASNGKALGILESSRALQQAFKRLSKIQRTTLELAFFEGLTMQEIAQTTGESFENIRHHYYRGLEKLRSIFSEPRPAELAGRGEVAHV